MSTPSTTRREDDVNQVEPTVDPASSEPAIVDIVARLDAVVLLLAYRVPAVKGAYRISTDIATAALTDKPVDKTEGDAR